MEEIKMTATDWAEYNHKMAEAERLDKERLCAQAEASVVPFQAEFLLVAKAYKDTKIELENNIYLDLGMIRSLRDVMLCKLKEYQTELQYKADINQQSRLTPMPPQGNFAAPPY